jgi:hypothetical protein
MPDSTPVCEPWKQSPKLDGLCCPIPHPVDLGPSDYHLFGKLKDSIQGTKFKDDASLVTAVKQWLQNTGPELYCEGMQALVLRWHKEVQHDGDS